MIDLFFTALSKNNKEAVILIDEYDHSLNSIIDQPKLQEEYSKVFHSFFSVIKDADNLRLNFVTGILPYSFTNLFSGANSWEVLTQDKIFAGLMGFTKEEIKLYFSDIWNNNLLNYDEEIQTMTDKYNGYHFCTVSSLTVFNPFSCINYLKARLYSQPIPNAWSESGGSGKLINNLIV